MIFFEMISNYQMISCQKNVKLDVVLKSSKRITDIRFKDILTKHINLKVFN